MALVCVTGCGESEARIDVTIDGDARVRASARSLRLDVAGGPAPVETEFVETRAIAEVGWPAEAVIVPRDGDASREVRISVQALDPAGSALARATATIAFVPGAAHRVILRLESGCEGASCAPPDDPPDGGQDGRAPDAGAARDAGTSHACTDERCDGTLDEDCDGRIDEGCACTDGQSRTCDAPRACTAGAQQCGSGRWGDCVGWVGPSAETCNGLDDDCDGHVDEGLTIACGPHGCRQTCETGAWSECRDRDGDTCRDERDDD